MSHCISVYIFKANHDQFLEFYPNVTHALSNDLEFIIVPFDDNFNIFDLLITTQITEMVVEAYTDYFGGFGDQHAIVHSRDTVYDGYYNITTTNFKTINKALSSIGVKSTTDEDEFDVIGLSRWRSNEDFYE